MLIDLTHVRPGESGIIRELRGGQEFARRAQNMGIRPGKSFTKISSHFWRGPQTIQIDKLNIAVGFGMATKIFVEVTR
jgi:ferrous iron transport protein A